LFLAAHTLIHLTKKINEIKKQPNEEKIELILWAIA